MNSNDLEDELVVTVTRVDLINRPEGWLDLFRTRMDSLEIDYTVPVL